MKFHVVIPLALLVAIPSIQAEPALREITTPPAELKIPDFYRKYIDANGYPIVGSATVNDYALREAAYLTDMMMAKIPEVRKAMIEGGSRLTIIAWNEFTTDLPEYAHFTPKDFWDVRARGTGGSETDPYCSCGEENLLAYPGDPYSKESILIHELAHNIHLRGLIRVDPTFDGRLQNTYDAAMKAGLWKGKYASVNSREYFAEGVQSWFDDNREDDHDHNHVNTRVELIEYDPGLAALCREVFGDTEIKYTKPTTRLHGHMAGYDPSKAPTFVWPERLLKIKEEIRAQALARGKNAEGKEIERELREMLGWKLHIDKKLLAGESKEKTEKALKLMQVQLEEIIRVLPTDAVEKIKKVPLYVSPPYPEYGHRAEYHPDGTWLKDNGRDPAMAQAVEFTNTEVFEEDTRRMPNFTLHELAHGYHHRELKNGYEHDEIAAAYNKAKASGTYNQVERRDANGKTRMDVAYAMTNPAEYFAEATEAYFSINDFYPYTRDELKKHDPTMYEIIEKVWGVKAN